MIPQERIEQAAGAYYDELLKEKNRTTGQFVGVPLTHKEIGSQVTGYIEGMTAGVRFAESEMKPIAIEFAEWTSENNFERMIGLWHHESETRSYTTSELFDKFLNERSAQ